MITVMTGFSQKKKDLFEISNMIFDDLPTLLLICSFILINFVFEDILVFNLFWFVSDFLVNISIHQFLFIKK